MSQKMSNPVAEIRTTADGANKVPKIERILEDSQRQFFSRETALNPEGLEAAKGTS